MTESIERAIAPQQVHPTSLLEQAFNNLSLGLIICDNKYEVVFCNKRYMEIYGLSSEQVKPGTPVRDLIQHRFNLGFKVLSKPDEYIQGRTKTAVVPGTTVHQYTDGRIISYTIYPLPDGGAMATHEDITAREEIRARLKNQYQLGKEQEEALRIRNLQFDSAINNMSHGLCFFDPAHRLIVCNDRLCRDV